jgi:hypothetical protein
MDQFRPDIARPPNLDLSSYYANEVELKRPVDAAGPWKAADSCAVQRERIRPHVNKTTATAVTLLA